MAIEAFPKLHFKYGFDDNFAADVRSRGWLDGTSVELTDGTLVPVFFYDPVRLAQDLEAEIAAGRPFIAERNMIVLYEITLQGMQAAVSALIGTGFFESDASAGKP